MLLLDLVVLIMVNMGAIGYNKYRNNMLLVDGVADLTGFGHGSITKREMRNLKQANMESSFPVQTFT